MTDHNTDGVSGVSAGPSHQTIGSHPQQCSPNFTASEASFLQIVEWLDNCIDKHRLCRQASSAPTTLPTRLIDVGMNNGSRLPFLSISHGNDTKREYLALIHCWGVCENFAIDNLQLRSTSKMH